MATGPVVRVHQAVTPTVRPEVRNPARGQKPQSFYLAATRKTADRGYVPRYDLDD